MKAFPFLAVALLGLAASSLAQSPAPTAGAQDYESEGGTLIKIEPPKPAAR